MGSVLGYRRISFGESLKQQCNSLLDITLTYISSYFICVHCVNYVDDVFNMCKSCDCLVMCDDVCVLWVFIIIWMLH